MQSTIATNPHHGVSGYDFRCLVHLERIPHYNGNVISYGKPIPLLALASKSVALLQPLGYGSFGKVYEARLLSTREKAALKTSILCHHSLDEVEALGRIKGGCYLAEIFSAWVTRLPSPKMNILLHFYEMGNLDSVYWDYMDKEMAIKWSQPALFCCIAGQMVVALEHIHSLGVVHTDLKSDNVMVDMYGNCKLMDYGVARLYKIFPSPHMFPNFEFFRQNITFNKPADGLVPPEWGFSNGGGIGTDFYQLGQMILFLLCGFLPTSPESQFSGMAAFIVQLCNHDVNMRLGSVCSCWTHMFLYPLKVLGYIPAPFGELNPMTFHLQDPPTGLATDTQAAPWQEGTDVNTSHDNPGQASMSDNPGQASISDNPGQASTSVSPGQASTSVNDGQASTSDNPGQASTSVNDGQASTSDNPGQASTSVNPGQASTSVNPDPQIITPQQRQKAQIVINWNDLTNSVSLWEKFMQLQQINLQVPADPVSAELGAEEEAVQQNRNVPSDSELGAIGHSMQNLTVFNPNHNEIGAEHQDLAQNPLASTFNQPWNGQQYQNQTNPYVSNLRQQGSVQQQLAQNPNTSNIKDNSKYDNDREQQGESQQQPRQHSTKSAEQQNNFSRNVYFPRYRQLTPR